IKSRVSDQRRPVTGLRSGVLFLLTDRSDLVILLFLGTDHLVISRTSLSATLRTGLFRSFSDLVISRTVVTDHSAATPQPGLRSGRPFLLLCPLEAGQRRHTSLGQGQRVFSGGIIVGILQSFFQVVLYPHILAGHHGRHTLGEGDPAALLQSKLAAQAIATARSGITAVRCLQKDKRLFPVYVTGHRFTIE